MRKLFQQNHARLGCSLSPRSPSFSGKGPAAAINHSRPETRTVAYDRRRHGPLGVRRDWHRTLLCALCTHISLITINKSHIIDVANIP